MKIAVCGSGQAKDQKVLDKAKRIGIEIAQSKNTLLTGGGRGYPYAAVRGAILEDGRVICYSPAKDKEDHISNYNFPFEESAEYIYTNNGIPGRNLDLVQNADAVIIIGGQIGTLNEFTIAFALNMKIGILNSGEITELIPKITEICDKRGESRNVFYSDDVKELIKKLLNAPVSSI